MDHIRNFGILLKDIARLYTQHFERRTGEIGTTLPTAKVLKFLSRNEGLTQARLAEITETDPMTLVRILNRMEKSGWIERRGDREDKRIRRLYLRKPALPVLDSIDRLASRSRGAALAGLPRAERETLIRLLEHVHRNLTAAESEAALVPARASARRRHGGSAAR